MLYDFLNKCALPQQCLLCAAAATEPVCAACHQQLPWLTGTGCPRCALPTPAGEICGACLKHPPRFDRVRAAAAYASPLAELIRVYKYQGALVLAPLFAQMLLPCVDSATVDLIIPLPLSRERLRERGFNQALEIARHVGRTTGISVNPHACRRVRDCAPQAALPWDERAKNIRGAFACASDVTGMRVAVVDDVLTTGATLNEIAKTLKRAGAVAVEGWVLARTL